MARSSWESVSQATIKINAGGGEPRLTRRPNFKNMGVAVEVIVVAVVVVAVIVVEVAGVTVIVAVVIVAVVVVLVVAVVLTAMAPPMAGGHGVSRLYTSDAADE